MKRILATLMACLAAIALATASAAALTVTTIDGETFEGAPTGVDDNAIVFALGEGKTRTVRLGDIDVMTTGARPDPSFDTGWLTIAGGDRVPANLVKGGGDKGLRFETGPLGEVTLAFKYLRGYLPASRAGSPVELEAGLETLRGEVGASDVVTFKTETGEDTLSGVIEGYGGESLAITADFGLQLDIDAAAIRRIAFSSDKFEYTPPKRAHVRVSTVDGSALRGVLKSIDAESMTLEHVTGLEPTIAMNRVVRIEVLGGNLVPIAQMKPASVKEWTEDWGAHPFPHVVDANVWHREMTMKGEAYSTGLGVRAESEITYKLGGRFEEFRATIGHDDIVSKAPGEIRFKAIGDGETLYESPVFGAGSKPEEIVVDVSGVDELTLAVRTPEGVSKGTMANWARARFIKK